MGNMRSLRLPLAVLLVSFVMAKWALFVVRGPSMAPTIKDPSLVVIVPSALYAARKDDVVMLESPWRQNTLVVKRISAVPGECLPLVRRRPPSHAPCAAIPDGYLFVEGDNRGFSEDSRTLGLVRRSAALGTVIGAMSLQALVNR